MRRYPTNVRIAINGSLPQKPEHRPQSRLAMQGQPWAAPTKTTPEPATKPKSRPDRRSDPLIANARVDHAQVPDQRPHRDQWAARGFRRAMLDARSDLALEFRIP